YYKDDSCWNADVKSKTTEDIISNRSFMEVLVLNHYVLVKNVFLLKGQGFPGQNKTPGPWSARVPMWQLFKRLGPVIPAPSTNTATTGAKIIIRLQAAISFPPEAEVERLLAMPTPSPSPLASLSPPSAGERLARCWESYLS
nr:hypothetical protein [Tanacetum cinerariifolium]